MLTSMKEPPPRNSSKSEEGFGFKKGLPKSIIFNHGEVETDMDISESEDIMESDESDEDWVESEKIQKKRRSRGKVFDNEDESIVEISVDICCSCSKYSLCKTKKCECRVLDKSCHSYCGCNTLKCANREDPCISLDDEKDKKLVSQGTLLLESALNARTNISERKPLSDIGNAQVNSNLQKPKKRKNWRKTTIQIVAEPLEPLVWTPDKKVPDTDDVCARLPRAMETNMSLETQPPFTDMNSIRCDESMNRSKDSRGTAPPRPASRLTNIASDQKENKLL